MTPFVFSFQRGVKERSILVGFQHHDGVWEFRWSFGENYLFTAACLELHEAVNA
jgi:hypothetical protein